jgi:TPP-dependent 2-oxoacid decarboxylase
MPMGEFLFTYLHHRGVRHSFGVPGDFALPTFAWLEKSPIMNVTMTHEPGAGFAADAYSRVNGIGLVCVTYCVGGLNVLNAIAGAYAEKSPVVVISGAPGRKDREKDPLLHHKVKTFETQRRVYDEVTVASCVLLDEERAAAEIVRCVEACLRHKRPVYIEVPHDMVDRQIPVQAGLLVAEAAEHRTDDEALRAALEQAYFDTRGTGKVVFRYRRGANGMVGTVTYGTDSDAIATALRADIKRGKLPFIAEIDQSRFIKVGEKKYANTDLGRALAFDEITRNGGNLEVVEK